MSNFKDRTRGRAFNGAIEVKEGADGAVADVKVVAAIGAEVKAMGGDVKALKESLQADLTAMRSEVAGVKGGLDPLVAEKVNKFAESILQKNEALAAEFKKIGERVDATETAMKRAPAGGAVEGDKVEAERKEARIFATIKASKAGQISAGNELTDAQVDFEGYAAWQKGFAVYLRKDEKGMTGDGRKALSVGSDPDGGYLVPTAVSNRILGKVFESSPIRSLATVETIGSDAMEIPIDEQEMGYGWVGEAETRSETTTAQFGVQRIPVHEMYAKPRATQKLLEDSNLDVEAWIARKIAEKFGRAEATAFVTGDGVKKPRGILSYAAGTTRQTIEQIVSGAASSITADGLINLSMSLKDAYLANASWLMKRSTQGAVLLLKDGQGQYMWRPGLVAGQPNTLLGYAVRQADDMPAVQAASLSVAFGDFRQAYTVVDRTGISTLRDPYSAKPFVEYYTRRRVGGDVVLFEAIKLLVTSV